MRTLLAAAALALVSTLAAAGCAPATTTSTTFHTTGEKGALTFKYDSCFFGCGLDRPALQGSAVQIEVKGGTSAVLQTARLTGTAVGRIASQSYSCDGGECKLEATIETTQHGDAKLEIVDETGGLVDGVVFHVKAAARIDVDVRGHEAGADGVFVVKQGEKLDVKSTVFDNDNTELIFDHHGVAQLYADKGIVGPDDDFMILGSSDVENAVANGTGETTLSLRAVGSESIVKFRVTK